MPEVRGSRVVRPPRRFPDLHFASSVFSSLGAASLPLCVFFSTSSYRALCLFLVATPRPFLLFVRESVLPGQLAPRALPARRKIPLCLRRFARIRSSLSSFVTKGCAAHGWIHLYKLDGTPAAPSSDFPPDRSPDEITNEITMKSRNFLHGENISRILRKSSPSILLALILAAFSTRVTLCVILCFVLGSYRRHVKFPISFTRER